MKTTETVAEDQMSKSALKWLRDAAREISADPVIDHGRVQSALVRAVGNKAVDPRVMPDHVKKGTQVDQDIWRGEMSDYEPAKADYSYYNIHTTEEIAKDEADSKKRSELYKVLDGDGGVIDTINQITGLEEYDADGELHRWPAEEIDAATDEFFDLEAKRQQEIAEGRPDPLRDQILETYGV